MTLFCPICDKPRRWWQAPLKHKPDIMLGNWEDLMESAKAYATHAKCSGKEMEIHRSRLWKWALNQYRRKGHL